MIFTDQDFSEMKYPVHTTPTVELFEKIPLFKEIIVQVMTLTTDRKWKGYLTAEQLMKYMAYVYHRQSPLAQRMADIIARKKLALEMSGVDMKKADENSKAKEFFFSVILSNCEFTNYLSLTFLKFENNMKWMQLCRTLEAWEDAQLQMQFKTEDTDKKTSVEYANIKTKLYQGCQKYVEDIDRISKELMIEDTMLANHVQSYLFVEKVRKRLITPEDYAGLSNEELTFEFKERGLLN